MPVVVAAVTLMVYQEHLVDQAVVVKVEHH